MNFVVTKFVKRVSPFRVVDYLVEILELTKLKKILRESDKIHFIVKKATIF